MSALVLSRLRFGAAPPVEDESAPRPGLFREARDGLAIIAGMAGIRAVIVASGAMLLFAGLFNVAELPYAINELDVGNAGFAGADGDLRARVRRGLAIGLEGRGGGRAQAPFPGGARTRRRRSSSRAE